MSAHKRPSRHSVRRVLVVALAIFVPATALVAVGLREAADPRFALGAVAVSGFHATPRSVVLLAAALPPGANVWLLDTSGAERRIEALPWIDTARIRRSWPNRLRIDVSERVPVALVGAPAGGGAEEPAAEVGLIDATLRVLAVEPAGALGPSERALPVFRLDPQPALEAGEAPAADTVQTAYDSLVQLRALGLHVSEVDIKPATGITVTCDGGLRVILGSEDDFGKKVALFKAIAPKIAQPQDVVYVDLRSVRAPTVLYR
jgi:cell division protein FtsQ